MTRTATASYRTPAMTITLEVAFGSDHAGGFDVFDFTPVRFATHREHTESTLDLSIESNVEFAEQLAWSMWEGDTRFAEQIEAACVDAVCNEMCV